VRGHRTGRVGPFRLHVSTLHRTRRSVQGSSSMMSQDQGGQQSQNTRWNQPWNGSPTRRWGQALRPGAWSASRSHAGPLPDASHRVRRESCISRTDVAGPDSSDEDRTRSDAEDGSKAFVDVVDQYLGQPAGQCSEE
jgi:hypothetical protein